MASSEASHGPAAFSVSVNGIYVSDAWNPLVTQIVITDIDGMASDTADVEFDDQTQGQIQMPEIGTPMAVSLGWKETGVQQLFSGYIDHPLSTGSRGSGHMFSIHAVGASPVSQAKA